MCGVIADRNACERRAARCIRLTSIAYWLWGAAMLQSCEFCGLSVSAARCFSMRKGCLNQVGLLSCVLAA
jgi:hypothetical protein